MVWGLITTKNKFATIRILLARAVIVVVHCAKYYIQSFYL